MRQHHAVARNHVRLILLLIPVGLGTLFSIGALHAQKDEEEKKLAVGQRPGERRPAVCTYPRYAIKRPFASRRFNLLINASDKEPNNTVATAQPIPLGFGGGQDVDVDVTGDIGLADVDVFAINAEAGDVLGFACIAPLLDSVLTLFDKDGTALVVNDQHGNLASLYPPISPLPAGGNPNDAVVSYVVPQQGLHFLQVSGFGSSQGQYRLQMRIRKPGLHEQAQGERQIVFLKFDGAKINAKQLFGEGGNENAVLAPLKGFLSRWNLDEKTDLNPLIDAIVAGVTTHLGDVAKTNPLFGFEVRNNKDHPEPPAGQANVMRVIIGGTITELGISTIGIAQFIDPGNFATDDTAVVLLDLLSAPAGDPNSINSLKRAPGLSQRDAVGRVVAAVTAHEIGHLLGCWHCRNNNAPVCLMDQGGDLENTAGIGKDRVLGSNDDIVNQFIVDEYADEGIVEPGFGFKENTNIRVGYALSTGTRGPNFVRVALERELMQAQLLHVQEALKDVSPARLDPFDQLRRGTLPVDDFNRLFTKKAVGNGGPGPFALLPEKAAPTTEPTADFWKQRTDVLKQKLQSLKK